MATETRRQPSRPPPCRFFQVGRCSAGQNCRFSHVPAGVDVRLQTRCRFFAAGYCANGERCPFLHSDRPRQDDAAASTSVPPHTQDQPRTQQTHQPQALLRSSTKATNKAQLIDVQSAVPEMQQLAVAESHPNEAAGLAQTQRQRHVHTEWLSRQTPSSATAAPARDSTSGQSSSTHCISSFDRSASTDNLEQQPEFDEVEATQSLQPFDFDYVDAEAFKPTEEEQKVSSALHCSVCLERVPPHRFGILTECDHCVCLSCIRRWRGTHAVRPQVARSCPVCRTSSRFVVPSPVFVSQPQRKAALIQGYLERLSTLPCKHFDFGNGTCPFGSSCFYAHVDKSGHQLRGVQRRVVGSAGHSKALPTYKLSDYLFPQESNESVLDRIPQARAPS